MKTYYAIFRGYICTANEDGSIPLNAKVVAALVNNDNGAALEELLAKANAYVKASPDA